MRLTSIQALFDAHDTKIGDWDTLRNKMAAEQFTILVTSPQGVRYDTKRDAYTAKFEMGTREASLHVTNAVAEFVVAQLHDAPYYWFLKMEDGVVTNAIAATMKNL